MRRMSFALTRDQLLDGSKTVTRRKGWRNLKPGDRLLAVSKCMGLRPGESAEVYGPIEVLSVRREPLGSIMKADKHWSIQNQDPYRANTHGVSNSECVAEGFPTKRGHQFVTHFRNHMGGDQWQEVTRIEFRRVEPRALDGVKLSPAMRALVLRFHEAAGEIGYYDPTIYTRTLDAIWARGLVSEIVGSVWHLTDLGRQVAAELREGAQ